MDERHARAETPHLQLHRQAELLFQGFFLLRAWREVSVEIQTAFAHGSYLRLGQQGTQASRVVAAPVPRVVRVQTSSTEQAVTALIQLSAKRQGMLAFLQTGAGQHQLADARLEGSFEQGLALVIEACMGQIDADVDELHGVTL